MRKIELLAPAGNIESFNAALRNGADAIYMGVGKYNARTMANNFTIEEYISCIKLAHKLSVKIYLTLNTLVYDNEIKEAISMLLELYKHGLDAVIVQDIGMAMKIKEIVPDLPLHASTQMSVYSLEQVKFLEELGFKRVVLARELTIPEIEYISTNTKLEIEVFVHGALCVSVSGQCLLSSTIGDRSANRGSCAQPCRKMYSLYNSKDELLQGKSYILSKKDILGLEYIKSLYNANVYSLKLEGRNKNPEYVAGITSIYRKNIDKELFDNKLDNKKEETETNENRNEEIKNDIQTLKQLFNRGGSSAGYLNGVMKKDSISLFSPKNTGIYLGKVLSKKGKMIKVKLECDIDMHDGFEVYFENAGTYETVSSSIITCIKDDKFNIVNSVVKKGNYVYLGDTSKNVPINSKVYKTSSYSLNKKMQATYKNSTDYYKKNTILIDLIIKKDKNILVSYYIDKNKYDIVIDYIPELALNKEINALQIQDNFNKTVSLPFTLKINNANIDNGLFIPVSVLNKIRNEILSSIDNVYDKTKDISSNIEKLDSALNIDNKYDIDLIKNNDKKAYLNISSYDKNIPYTKKYKNTNFFYINIIDIYKNENEILNNFKGYELGLVINNVIGKNMKKYILNNLEDVISKFKIKKLFLGSYHFLDLALLLKKKYSFILVAGNSLNITNSYSALFIKNLGFDEIILTGEHDSKSIENISKILPTYILNGQICVMTSRYCVVGSFVKGKNYNKIKNCTMPCLQDKYYLKDMHGYNYDIICDNTDCISKIQRYVKAPDIKNTIKIEAI